MPRIAIVSEYFYPLLGGITENVYNTALRLAARGWQVKIITSNVKAQKIAIPPKPWLAVSPNLELLRLGYSLPVYANGSWGHFTLGLKLRAQLKELLTPEKFDLVHIHSPLVPTLPYLALSLTEIPAVGTFHTYFDSNIFHNLIYGLLNSRLQKDADKLSRQIFVSQSCITPLARYLRLNPLIIPNGVDINEFSPDVPRLEKFGPDKLNLLFVGRFDPRNGLEVMLKAFTLIKENFKEVRLIVVGGPVREKYLKLVPAEFRSDVFFVGPILEERPNYYASCDIFCSPVDKASFGITLLEAMSSGQPIVATENVGYDQLLGPEESIIVARKSPEELAAAVIDLLQDEELRKKMGEAGRRKALNYSWDKIVSELEKVYQTILDQK